MACYLYPKNAIDRTATSRTHNIAFPNVDILGTAWEPVCDMPRIKPVERCYFM